MPTPTTTVTAAKKVQQLQLLPAAVGVLFEHLLSLDDWRTCWNNTTRVSTLS